MLTTTICDWTDTHWDICMYIYIYLLKPWYMGAWIGSMESKRLQWIYCTCSVRELDDYPVDISDVWLMVTHIRMGTQLYTSGSPLNGHFRNAHHFQTHSWAIGWWSGLRQIPCPSGHGMSQTSHDSLDCLSVPTKCWGTALASWLVPLGSTK